MTILAIGAHPDDIEFGCAPVILKEAKRGTRAKLLVLSRGEAGSNGTPESREQESRRAAELLGGTVDFLDFGGDCHLEYSPANAIRIAAEIRRAKPDIVLAPYPEENQHPDHAVAGKLARDACRLARYGGLNALKPLASHSIRSLYFYTITQQFGRSPDVVKDIGDVMDEWEAAMNCHESQMKSKGYVELEKAKARSLGLSIGVSYAAGLYANDPLMLESLSDITLSSRHY